MPRPSCLLVLALLLVPTVQAGLFERTVVEAGEMRVGDVLRFEGVAAVDYRGERNETEFSSLYRVEPVGRAVDSFGREREAETFLAHFAGSEGDAELIRCVRAAGSPEVFRHDRLTGPRPAHSSSLHSFGGLPLLAWPTLRHHGLVVTSLFDGMSCVGILERPPRLVEGETYRLRDVSRGLADLPGADALSRPAERTTFHGRKALVLTYDAADLDVEADGEEPPLGHLSFTFAEGLATVARVEVSILFGGEDPLRLDAFVTLTGLTAGDGPALAPTTAHPTQERNPSARFVPFDPVALDEEAFDFPYPFSEAMEVLRADSKVGLEEFLRRNPDAVLLKAFYDRHWRPERLGSGVETDGGWLLTFQARGGTLLAQTVRGKAPGPLAGVLQAPGLLVENSAEEGSGVVRPEFVRPVEVARSDVLAAVALAHGVGARDVKLLEYDLHSDAFPDFPSLTLYTVSPSLGSAKGRAVVLDVAKGGAHALADAEAELFEISPLAALVPERGLPREPSRAATLSLLGVPVDASGLAAPAVGLVALFFILLKFVVLPLYTRLVRSRMLEHPERADLVRRVREAPGVRLAELLKGSGVADTAARRHVKLLVKHGFLVELREGGTVSYYVRGEVPHDAARRSALLRRPSTRDAYELLSREPHLSLRQAAARLGLSAPSVHRHKRLLEKAGLLPAQQRP